MLLKSDTRRIFYGVYTYEKITNELHVLEDWYNPKLSYKLSVVYSSKLNHDNRMKEFYAKIPPKENQ